MLTLSNVGRDMYWRSGIRIGNRCSDEAHNFRNVNQRSIGFRDYLGKGDHKVVLLSATPQNMGPRDILRQLRLFLPETITAWISSRWQCLDFFSDAEIGSRIEVGRRSDTKSGIHAGGDLADTPRKPTMPTGHACEG